MKYPNKLLRDQPSLRGLKKDALLRDPLLPVRRSFDDDADDWTGVRLGWQPARPLTRLPQDHPARPTAAPHDS